MGEDELNAIEARAAKASPGPWQQCCASGGGCGGFMVWRDPHCERMVDTRARGDSEFAHGDERDFADAAFIAHARADVPALVAEVRRLRAAASAGAQRAGEREERR